MSTPVIVCDDSQMARKQLIRALPEDWPVTITQAAHGGEALDAVRAGKGKILFLDLTMPILDGYETLMALRDEGIMPVVIVVSGDVQEQAVLRVMRLGAACFLQKPVEKAVLERTLTELCLRVTPPVNAPAPMPVAGAVAAPSAASIALAGAGKTSFRDAFREICNVAMGRAAALLAKVLDVFIKLPIPNVNEIDPGELLMALSSAQGDSRVTAVCQGFISSGIAGEALLLFHDASVQEIAQLMKTRASTPELEMEMLMDISSIIIGACLKGLAEQIDTQFSQGHPVVLGQHCKVADLMQVNQQRWKKMLAVEIAYTLEAHKVSFDLLLLFTEDSIPRLHNKLSFMTD